MSKQPLIVDLDGTLINTDMLHESAISVFKSNPLTFFQMPKWLKKGKAQLKRHFSARSEIDPKTLPYNKPLITWLKTQRAAGRQVILCTASDTPIAEAIAEHLGIFDEVIASDGNINVAGQQKADLLVARFGEKAFDYVGNSRQDLSVWAVARQAIVVNGTEKLIAQAKVCGHVTKIFPKKQLDFTDWRKMLRVHQWLKNALLFVPLFAGHTLANVHLWGEMLVAFFAFSLCASSVYIANDLLDLDSDRQHPRKGKRPFASGRVPIALGAILSPVLFLVSVLLALSVNTAFTCCLVLYFVITCLYSLWLKRLVLIDCMTLALLFTIRIIAGALALQQVLSFWLLAFSVFLFLSLAFVKRYAEIEVQRLRQHKQVHGRGYRTDDAPLIQTMGIAAGYVSVLVLSLYLNSDSVVVLYRSPEWLWGGVLIVMFWISWMWMQAHRGYMHDDPIVFAVKDKVSLLAGVCFAIMMLLGTKGGL